MMYTCKCLNVKINVKFSKPESVCETFPDLILEKNDPFFKEDLEVVQVDKIMIEQSNLIQTRECNAWVLTFCVNCSLNTHAVHSHKSSSLALVNKCLLNDPNEISILCQSENFSPVFKIIVDPVSDTLSPIPAKISVSKSLQPALAALHRQLENYIQQKKLETEEKIQKFKEEEYMKLDSIKTLAHQNHQALVRVLVESSSVANSSFEMSAKDWLPSQPVLPLKTESPRTVPINPLSPKKMEFSSFFPKKVSQPISVMRSSKTAPSDNVAASLDSEGLFTLEGMEDENIVVDPHIPSEDELSDTDDSGSHDEGIHIPRRRLSSFAKSMPVNVPVFDFDLQDDRKKTSRPKSPANPSEIAASMKALARSVHGDTVFGDLPRPRFSSQL